MLKLQIICTIFLTQFLKFNFTFRKQLRLLILLVNITITDAAEKRLAIIGEAVWKVTKNDNSIKISDYKKIISLRHILIH